jgi:hypothetical protein
MSRINGITSYSNDLIATARSIDHFEVSCGIYEKQLLNRATLGNVDTAGANNAIVQGLRLICKAHGLDVENKPNSNQFVYGAGSVFLHKDHLGSILEVCVLVGVENLSELLQDSYVHNYPCALITEGEFIELEIGDVFIFDPSIYHAWMSNRKWLIATQSVIKPDRSSAAVDHKSQ